MDFLHKLLNRPTPKPAICHRPRTPRESAGEPSGATVRPSQPETPTSEVASNSSGPSSLAQESLSSASSFQSLSSKSSSGICADSAPGSPDKSYVNVNIPDVDDLISACANINLEVEPAAGVQGEDDSAEESISDRSQDQTFASAADDTISEETHGQQLEEALQTFQTCPTIEAAQQAATARISAERVPSDSSVLPYVSFEESVLRKHQEKSEEFKSALASFQLSVTGTLDEQQRASPTPCIEIDVAASSATIATSKPVDGENSAFVGSPFSKINELQLRETVAALDSPDVSFKEVSSFDATVLIDTDTEESISRTSITPTKLNVTVLQSPAILSKLPAESENIEEKNDSLNKTQDIAPENILNKTQDFVKQENDLNITEDLQEIVLNKTQDLVKQNNDSNKAQDIVPENTTNKTQDLIKQENVLNQIHDLVKEENILNKTQDIINENVLNQTQDLVKQENVLNKTQDIVLENVLNKTQDIVTQENVLNKTQDIIPDNVLNKTQDLIKEENVLNKTEDIIQENVQNKTQDFVIQENVLNKTEDIVQENVLNKTQDFVKQENVLNKTQDIVLENVLNKTQDIVLEKTIIKSEDIIKQESILNKTQDIVSQNVLNKSVDIVNQNILNKTQDIVQESVLNKTHDIVNQENIFNKSQDIIKENSVNNNTVDVQETQVLNTNQSITQEINANDTQEKLDNSALVTGEDNLNETLLIVQKAKQHLTEVDALVKNENDTVRHNTEVQNFNSEPILDANKELKEQKNKIIIQEAKSPQKVDLNVQNRIKSPDKTELIVPNPISEEVKSTILDNIELVASTPFEKVSNKEPTPKPSNRRSALFSQNAEEVDNKESAVEDNRTELESTIVISNFEETKDLQEASFHFLPPREPEYEAFKPQQQSTTLPVNEGFDLAEAALSVAKDIDASLDQIEESEKFVSATELFGDPAAFDFLNQVGSQNTKRGERYDSLFMKFDPLAQRLSMLPQKNLPTAPSVEEEEDIVKETKPASPVAAANFTPTIPNMNTPKKNPALAAIDRLLFYSPTVTEAVSEQVAETKQKKEVEKQESISQAPVIDEKMAKELELVRLTVLQLEAELEKQKKEHKEALEKQKTIYEEKINSTQTKFTQMQSQLSQEVKCKDQMTVVVEEYEKSISRLIAEREKDRTNFETERAKLQEELQVANQHLSNTEAAFSDVHSKYERLKNVVAAYKANENVLKDSIADNQETIKSLENRYEQLKSHAMAQLEKANLELSAIRKQNEAENIKLKALVRKAELKSKSLEETVEQKLKENKELTKIIDEMIARVE